MGKKAKKGRRAEAVSSGERVQRGSDVAQRAGLQEPKWKGRGVRDTFFESLRLPRAVCIC
jgi:hypothetical protein